jgi:hypothetical protein
MLRLILLAPAALLLAGCDPQTLKGSIAGGECRIFERPAYVVRGVRRYDQDWIDSQVEGGVGGCGWARPAPRPAELDAPGAAVATSVSVKPAKKRGVVARIKAAVHREPDAVPPPAIEAVPPSPPVDADPQPVLVPPPAPRSRLELLLDPSGPAVVGAGR